MKTQIITPNRFAAGIIIILSFLFSIPSNCQEKEKIYVAIEFNEVLCGYSEIDLSDINIKGKEYILLKQNTYANFHVLGRDISQHQKFTYHIDTESGNFIYHDSYHKQEDVKMGGAFYFEDNKIRTVSLDGEVTISEISEGVILPNTQFYPYLINEPENKLLWPKKLSIYDVRSGKIKKMEYSKIGEERMKFAGIEYDALIIKESDPSTGMNNKLWISKKDGMRLKMESPQQIRMYLTDASVPNRIKTGNWDDLFFVKTNKKIDDIRSISYMKVRVKLEATPSVSMDDLNVSGQQFSGTVNENAINGEFIISHKKYNGDNSPEFPFDQDKYEFSDSYLKPELTIEANDHDITALAKKITYGSETLWEACCKLSSWVAENIDGSILDGSAKETYESKSGLCGAQSRLLAALCRAAGIPARVVWGCLYTREMGGSFGHHGWNEVFMGKAGWIPIDVTIHETDYLDSGHFRLGVLHTAKTVIKYEEANILDYRTKN